MVKRGFLALMICLFLAPFTIAYADLIWEPENNFYQEHKSNMVALDRSFTVNGTNGTVAVKEKPGAKQDVTSIKNGTVIYIHYSCLYGGEYWGYTEYYGDSVRYSGWVKLDQMLVHYDYKAFAEQHRNEFYEYKGAYSEMKDPLSCVTWDWPGADHLKSVTEVYLDHFSIVHAYKDKDGREWGFITDYKGSIGFWVCLSDPLNQSIPAFNPEPEPYLWVSMTTHVDLIDSDKGSDPPIVAISAMVAFVVAGTAALIRVFWKRKPQVNSL